MAAKHVVVNRMTRSRKPQPVLYVCNDCGLIALGNGETVKSGEWSRLCAKDDLHDWRLVDWEPYRKRVAVESVREYRAMLIGS